MNVPLNSILFKNVHLDSILFKYIHLRKRSGTYPNIQLNGSFNLKVSLRSFTLKNIYVNERSCIELNKNERS